MKIVVIGGTGVAILRQGGQVVAAPPKSGINTITGEGPQRARGRRAGRDRPHQFTRI